MDNFFDKFGQISLAQKIIGFVVLCIISIAVYIFLFQNSVESDIMAQKRQIQVKKNELADVQQKMIKIKEYEAEAKRLDKKLEEALSLLPEKSEIPKLLEKISNLAEKAGLAIAQFTPLGEIPEDFFVRVPIDLKLNGSYQELINFFDAVSKLRRVVNITDITIERRFMGEKGFLKDDVKTKVGAQCLGVTFRFAGKDAAPAKVQGKKKGGH